ncbi:MAG: TetR/AcrR family transcriptional regulator [Vibrionaceae bacterium]|nr:TetR/AcrR family transcriptional regulator [Vibrionaceae bacterium]
MNERSFTRSGTMLSNTTLDKKTQILCAAEKLIAELGFQGFSMQKLAKEAGVAAGTIYRYFSDKNHLLDEVRLNVAKRVAIEVQAGVSDDMPLKERYTKMWLNIWCLAGSNVDALNNRVQYQSLPYASNRVTMELERKMFDQVDRLFDQGKEQGVFKPLDNMILSGLSFEATVALARHHALGLYQLDEAAIEAAIEASWDAIIQH